MSKRLLLVERSLAIQKLVEIALTKEGVEVITVTDGLSALDILGKVPPDLLIVDSELEGMNLHAFLGRVKGKMGLKQFPVLLLTEPTDLVDQETLRAAGVLGYVEKPLEASRLRERVIALLHAPPTGATVRDPEETLVAPFASMAKAPLPLSTQDEEGLMNIEELLGWSPEAKSPFSELEEEKRESDFNFPLDEARGVREVKEEAVVVDDEAEVLSSVEVLHTSENSPSEESYAEAPTTSIILSEADPEESPSPPSMAVETSSLTDPDQAVSGMTQGEIKPSSLGDSGHAVTGMSQEQMEAIVSKISREVIEKVVWEVVPALAEVAIQKEIERLKAQEST
jgi:CheY-like chemotaxis protein